MKREVPFKAWVLMPSFKPVEVELVKQSQQWSNWDIWYATDKGKTYKGDSLFASKEDAIAFGRDRLAEQEADLAKRSETIAKKRAALDKAEAQQ